VSENARTLRGASALEAGDLGAFGALMDESHASLRDDYEVVPPRLDELAAALRAVDGCFGSRITGAGFGGCTVSLVRDDAVDGARAAGEHWGATVYVCRPSDGVRKTETAP
jgi:galactokinase